MAINFLQSIGAPPMPAASMPPQMQPPPPAMPQPDGNLQRMTQGAPEMSRIANIMQAIGGSSDTPPVQMPAQMQQPATAAQPRKRRSILDTIGRISDVIATVGGADALYQPTLDAREDRARGIDLDEMRKQLTEQQLTQGQQTIDAGNIELADSERGRIAQALGAVANNPDAIAMWPQIAKEAGIDDARAAQIGGLLQAQPEMAGALAQSLGYSPQGAKGQGSQAKELQVYGLLMEQGGPELANAYLQNLVNPDAMSEYQKAQLAISLRQLGLQESKFVADEERADEKAAGGADLTPRQRGDITMKLKLIPVARTQYNRVKELYNEMIQDGTFARGGLGGLIPSQLAGGKAEEFEKAIGALRKSILSMTRVPGIGAMSNYETMLDEAALPSRWGSDEGRAEAINNIGMLLENYEAGYKDMLGSTPPARSAPRRNAPGRGSGNTAPAPRRSMSPAAEEARRRGLIK
jgi:hypothetical protein